MYGKLFAQMYDGTLATRGPWQALVTFQQMIILADKHGVIDMTAEAISRRTTVPLEIIRLGLTALEEPDNQSRTPDLDGRRIVRLSSEREWGWQIVNYTHYRNMRSQEERREYMRRYQREYRAKHAGTKQSTMQTAHRLVREAVGRGELIPMDCEVCGAKQTDAHHEDYSKPLVVRWLCRAHHQQEHDAVNLNVNRVNKINQSSKQYAVSSMQEAEERTQRPVAPLPVGVSSETWEGFKAHRKALKSPLTPQAEKALATKLQRLASQGFDPEVCLTQSLENGWKGVFKVEAERASTGKPNQADKRAKVAAAIWGDKTTEASDAITGTAERLD